MSLVAHRFVRLCLLVLPLALAGPAAAQARQWDPRQVGLSREELDSLLARYDQTATAVAYSGDFREQARREAALIRTRLTDGDFQVGDQVALEIEGEAVLSDSFTVQPGPSIVLPDVGRISLAGVLRSELEAHLRSELSRYIRDPDVSARSSIRLLVSGAVGRTGYHMIPTHTVFTEVLMLAGGPTSSALLKEIRVERSDRVIWSGASLQQAIIEGRTLDQMSIRAGDEIIVPEKAASGESSLTRIARIVGPLVVIGRLFSILF